MAKDKISVRFSGGQKLDKALKEIANLKQSAATRIVTTSLTAANNQLKKSIKSVTPVSEKGSTGRDGSRGAKTKVKGHTKGTLKRSIQSRRQTTSALSRERDVFAASVYVSDGHGKNPEKNPNKDGWYAHFVQFGTSGSSGQEKNDFMYKGLKLAEKNVKNKLGSSLAKKIAKFGQQKINNL